MKVKLAVIFGVLCAGFDNGQGAPEHYWKKHASKEVRQLHQQRRVNTQQNGERLCHGGVPDAADAGIQKQWWSKYDCSVASQDVSFFYNETYVVNAKKGDVIPWHCESAFCPPPKLPDCYQDPGICQEDEFCHIIQHERWGPWAMQKDGGTNDETFCAQNFWQEMDQRNIGEAEKMKLISTYNSVCKSNGDGAGEDDYKPIRGRCVKYRQEQQSCFSETFYSPKKMKNQFLRASNGVAFERPLVCDEGKDLICTGPDYSVLPSTCVPKRPMNTCFYGNWWDSSICLRTEAGAPKAGLTLDQAKRAAATALLLFPGDVGSPSTCVFWDKTSNVGALAFNARFQLYNILGALWPTKLLGPAPSLEELEALNPNPTMLPGGVAQCYTEENDANSTVPAMLHDLGAWANRPNLVWSLVHFVMHNQPNPMSQDAVEASRALAVFLETYFWCSDCRSFFAIGVIKEYGLPSESSTNPTDHARWWWWAHNVASEHISVHRGGHPWVYPLGNGNEAIQNPFFMAWEDAVEMWTVI